jgi:hypothetical protein
MVTQLTTFVHSWTNNTNLKWKEYRQKHVGKDIVNKIHNKYCSALVGYLNILDLTSMLLITWNFLHNPI